MGQKPILEICRAQNITEQTSYRWKKKYQGLDLAEVKCLKALEKENGELKKMLADTLLENRALKLINEKKIVSPRLKKNTAKILVDKQQLSRRRAYKMVSLSRSTFAYECKTPENRKKKLMKEMIKLSETHPRYEYQRITCMFRNPSNFLTPLGIN